MPPSTVATAFVRHRGEVLLVRRGEDDDGEQGGWDGISAAVARGGSDPERSAEREAREEIDRATGLLDGCTLVRSGDPVAVGDRDGDSRQVHPFLFDCARRTVDPGAGATDVAWGPPTAMLRRETVPGLWTAYDRVRPSVATVEADREHGSAYLSVRALEVLRDRAGELAAEDDHPDDGWETLAATADDLLAARPGMAALATRLNRVLAESARSPAAVAARAHEAIGDALDADDGAAAAAADHLAGTVLTLSRSGTVLDALRRADPEAVVAAESRPGGEGVAVADELADEGHDVTLIPDAAVAAHLGAADVDAVVVGADTVLADGSVVNKVGTRGAAVAAAREGVPSYAVAARDKISPETTHDSPAADPTAVYDGDADVDVAAPLFDRTPADLVDAIVTEHGLLDTDDVRRIAAEHRALADWR